jgi:ribosomal protein L11 methylase PrmA
MTGPTRDKGSFRDPSGYIFEDGDRIVRAVMPAADVQFGAIYDSGIIGELSAKGLMIDCTRLDSDAATLATYKGARDDVAAALYEHPKVGMISYPYEWSFSQLKDAALAHLDLQMLALERDYELSDATAYNMQFVDGRPVHIDVMSLRPYVDGVHWAGYNQFCRQFLLPLLLEAWAGVSFQSMYRGSINGISFEDALSILPRRKLFTSISGLLHVYMHGQAVMANSSGAKKQADLTQKLPKNRYAAILEQLRSFIAGLESAKRPASYWKTYAAINSYSEPMRDKKLAFVADWAAREKPKAIWDIGGNTGDFSLAAIEAGAGSSVILDGDLDSLDAAYRLRVKKGKPLLPIFMNLVDPTPNMGWRQSERKGLQERASADGIIALAVIHHMAISGNLPLAEAVQWLLNLAPTGIIEFVPKQDPMVAQLLAIREDIFSDYEEEVFLDVIKANHDITDQHKFAENGRLLVSYRKR